MRGTPLIESLAAFLALLLVALPIRGLTLRSRPAPKPVVSAAQPRPVRLAVVSTAEPFQFEVSCLGKKIWSGTGHRLPAYTDVQLSVPKEGVDLELAAQFPDSTLHAVRLTLALDDGTQVERSAWGNARLDEVLTFQPAF